MNDGGAPLENSPLVPTPPATRAPVPSPQPGPPVAIPSNGTVGNSERPWEHFLRTPARALEQGEARAILDDLASRGWLHVQYGPVHFFATYPGARISAVTVGGAPFLIEASYYFWDLRIAVLLYRLAFYLAREGARGLWVQGYRNFARLGYGVHDQGRALDIFGAAMPRGVAPAAPVAIRMPRDCPAAFQALDPFLIHDYWANLPIRDEGAAGAPPIVGHSAIGSWIDQNLHSFSSVNHLPRRARLTYAGTPTYDVDDHRSLTGQRLDPDPARRTPAEQAAFEAMRARLVLSNHLFSTILKVVYENATLNSRYEGRRGSVRRVGSGLTEDPGTANGVRAGDILTWDEVIHPDYRGTGRKEHQEHIHVPIGNGAWMRDYDDGWPVSTPPAPDPAAPTPGPRGSVEPRDRAAAAAYFANIVRNHLRGRYPHFLDDEFAAVRALVDDEERAEAEDTGMPGPGGAPVHLRTLRGWCNGNFLPPRRDTVDATDVVALAAEVQAALEARRETVTRPAPVADHPH